MEEGMELATEVIIRAEELTRTLYVNKERLLKMPISTRDWTTANT